MEDVQYPDEGLIVRVTFWGDAITPVYYFDVLKPGKRLWWKSYRRVWRESIHREDIVHYRTTADKVVANYKRNLERFSN